jgi:2-iminobutanoate/2-iminopropanoate deaminase
MATGELETRDIAKATTNCLNNLRAIWEAAGGERSGVVKVSVFMTDLGDFEAMNGAYAAFFGEDKPARACVQVAALPKGAPIEIEAIVAVS